MARCSFDHAGAGPQCCVTSADGTHAGPHLFKCSGPSCQGLIWPPSVMAHPYTCAAPVTLPPADPTDFNGHLDGCQQCRDQPMQLCPTGAQLLRSTVAAGPVIIRGGDRAAREAFMAQLRRQPPGIIALDSGSRLDVVDVTLLVDGAGIPLSQPNLLHFGPDATFKNATSDGPPLTMESLLATVAQVESLLPPWCEADGPTQLGAMNWRCWACGATGPLGFSNVVPRHRVPAAAPAGQAPAPPAAPAAMPPRRYVDRRCPVCAVEVGTEWGRVTCPDATCPGRLEPIPQPPDPRQLPLLTPVVDSDGRRMGYVSPWLRAERMDVTATEQGATEGEQNSANEPRTDPTASRSVTDADGDK